MRGPVLTQNITADVVAVLTKTDGTPATGLTFASVSCQFAREGDPSMNVKVLTALNFVELGVGFYRVTFDGATELNVVGQFVFMLAGAGLQNSPNEAQIVSAASLIPTTSVVLPTCTLTGNVNDVSGAPIPSAAVSVRVLGLPTVMNQVGVTDDTVSVVTDDNGVFNIVLVRLAVVEILIPRINYRRQLTVPNSASANLFTGIP